MALQWVTYGTESDALVVEVIARLKIVAIGWRDEAQRELLYADAHHLEKAGCCINKRSMANLG